MPENDNCVAPERPGRFRRTHIAPIAVAAGRPHKLQRAPYTPWCGALREAVAAAISPGPDSETCRSFDRKTKRSQEKSFGLDDGPDLWRLTQVSG
jgi:hypothetical protein